MSAASGASDVPWTLEHLAPLSEPQALGALLHGSRHADPVLALLDESDPTDPRAAALLRAVHSLREAAREPEPAAVLGELRRTGALVGGAQQWASSWLLSLHGGCVFPAQGAWHAVDVIEASLRRRVQEQAARLVQQAADAALEHLLAVVVAEHAAVLEHSGRLVAARAAAGGAGPSAVLRSVAAA